MTTDITVTFSVSPDDISPENLSCYPPDGSGTKDTTARFVEILQYALYDDDNGPMLAGEFEVRTAPAANYNQRRGLVAAMLNRLAPTVVPMLYTPDTDPRFIYLGDLYHDAEHIADMDEGATCYLIVTDSGTHLRPTLQETLEALRVVTRPRGIVRVTRRAYEAVGVETLADTPQQIDTLTSNADLILKLTGE